MWGHRIINLTFHGIGDPQRRLEPGEEQIWLDPEHFEAILASAVGQSDVRITFDDGNTSDLEYALPALRRCGLTATFFMVAGRLGVPGFLDESGVRELAAAGMDVGSHGMHHRPWRRLDDRALREELVDAKELLEGVIERPVTEAACPFGSYDCRVLRALARGMGTAGPTRAIAEPPGPATGSRRVTRCGRPIPRAWLSGSSPNGYPCTARRAGA